MIKKTLAVALTGAALTLGFGSTAFAAGLNHANGTIVGFNYAGNSIVSINLKEADNRTENVEVNPSTKVYETSEGRIDGKHVQHEISLSDLKTGDTIRVNGTPVSFNTIKATKIVQHNGVHPLMGTITGVSGNGNPNGTVTVYVSTKSGIVTITTNGSTVYDKIVRTPQGRGETQVSASYLQAGDKVGVHGTMINPNLMFANKIVDHNAR